MFALDVSGRLLLGRSGVNERGLRSFGGIIWKYGLGESRHPGAGCQLGAATDVAEATGRRWRRPRDGGDGGHGVTEVTGQAITRRHEVTGRASPPASKVAPWR